MVVASGFTVGKSPTHHKDKLHPCNLLLSGDDACVFVRTFMNLSRPFLCISIVLSNLFGLVKPKLSGSKLTLTNLF